MAKKKKNPNIRMFFTIKTNLGMLQKSPQYPRWTDNLLYTKLYAKRGTAQSQITKYRKNWHGVEWAEVAELKLTYVGTLDEIAERELLESVHSKGND